MEKLKQRITAIAEALRSVAKKVGYVIKITNWAVTSLGSIAGILDAFPIMESPAKSKIDKDAGSIEGDERAAASDASLEEKSNG